MAGKSSDKRSGKKGKGAKGRPGRKPTKSGGRRGDGRTGQRPGAKEILAFLRSDAGRPLKPRELAQALGVRRTDYPEFRETLRRLVAEGKLYEQRKGRLGAPEDLNLVIGRLEVTRKGSGFVVPDEGPDVFVRQRDLRSAVEGDRVVVRIERRPPDRAPQGRVIRIAERAHSRVVGVYRARRGAGWVEAREPKLGLDFFVPAAEAGEAGDGDLVAIEVLEWGESEPAPVARVSRVLGKPGDPGVDVLAIQVGYELPEAFPDAVEAAAARLAGTGIQAADLEGREDLRDELVFTIDPADARDHDDAISLRPLAEGGAWVGVHIADVAHYVLRGEPLDAEAWERGTSIYLVDRVIPMLPHALSSGLCSLVPDEDRLALSVWLRVDGGGRMAETRLAKSVIRSRHRLSYDEAQAILDGEMEADGGLTTDLRALHDLSRGFRRRRLERGSLDFDLPESRVVLDEAGEPTGVYRVLRLPAHQLIEDLMIAANEAVAAWALREAVPILFRIHEEPDPDKLDNLRDLAADFGLSVPKGRVRPLDLQRLLASVKDTPQEPLLAMATLRSMLQARYSPENVGHYGLASQAYAHFTSPIRRYPDLVVHRQVARWLDAPPTARSIDREWLSLTAKHASARERLAAEAERDSIELKKIQFMERHLGDVFEATISGVTAFGIFVLLDPFHIDGLVHVSSLEDDYYRFDERRHALVGRRTRRELRLGDRVEVQVVRVDREERKIDFQLTR